MPAWDGGDRNVNGKTRALNIDVTTCGESAIEDEYRGHERFACEFGASCRNSWLNGN